MMSFYKQSFIILCGTKYSCDTEDERKIAAQQLKKFKIPETMILLGEKTNVDTWEESGYILSASGFVFEDKGDV